MQIRRLAKTGKRLIATVLNYLDSLMRKGRSLLEGLRASLIRFWQRLQRSSKLKRLMNFFHLQALYALSSWVQKRVKRLLKRSAYNRL